MNISRIAKRSASFIPFIALFASAPALAGASTDIPEPGILSLFALGGAVMVAITIRKRRNKK